MNHGESVGLTSAVVFVPGSFLSHERLHTLVTSSPFYLLPLRRWLRSMKFAFEIKTEPVTQASIIVAVVAFSSGSLATIAIYAQSLSSFLSFGDRSTLL